jgi:ribosome-associated protein
MTQPKSSRGLRSTHAASSARPKVLVVSARLSVPLSELRFSFSRSSGPGGQNVNKVSTKATLRWAAMSSPSLDEELRARLATRFGHRLTSEGELLVTSQRFRDARRNRLDCLAKLSEILAQICHTRKARRPTRPSRGAVQQRLDEKRRRSERKRGRRVSPSNGGNE